MKRQTPQRVAIEAAFVSARRPLSPQEVLHTARRQVPSLNLATVYRTLKRMVDEKTIHQVELPGAPPRYELPAAAENHHHYFQCRRCDAVFDLEGCVAGLIELLPKGFSLAGHDIFLYGFCRACTA